VKRPWMPLYIEDYLSATADLRIEEQGCYFLLLLLAWRQPNCALPNDMRWLKRALSACAVDVHGNRFNCLVPDVLNRFFVLDSDGLWRQPRLISEWEKAEKFSRNQKQKVEKRWSLRNNVNGLANTMALPARTGSQSHIDSTTTVYEDTGEKRLSNIHPITPQLAALVVKKGWVDGR
jgi:uncharacterized protein YdaU (DUF1376 family)